MNLILFTMNNLNNNLPVVLSEATSRLNTESIIDLPHSAYIYNNTNIQTNVLPQAIPINTEVQTKSFWKLFKKSLKKFFCINDSDITPQEVRVENVTYNIMDEFNFGQAFSQTDATFCHSLIDGVNQYFICIGDTFLSVNPDLINIFL